MRTLCIGVLLAIACSATAAPRRHHAKSEAEAAAAASSDSDASEPEATEGEKADPEKPEPEKAAEPVKHKPAPTSAEIHDSVRQVFAAKPLAFCTKHRACLHRDQVELCEQVDREACPGFSEACAQKPMRMCEDDEPDESSRNRAWHLPNLGGIGRWLFFGLLLVAVVVLVLWLLRNRRWGTDAVAAVEPIEGAGGALPELDAGSRGPIETDVDRLLAAARTALAAGAATDAVQHAYAAIMRHLEARGLVEIEIWRTNGDYLRALAGQPELRREVAPLFAAIEQLQFGPRPPSHDEAAALLQRAARITGRVLALFLFCAGLLGACDGRFGGRSADDGPWGRSAVVRLLAANGFHAERRIASIEKIPETDAIVLLPSAGLEPEQWQKLIAWVESGGVLVIAGQMSLPSELSITVMPVSIGTPKAELASDYSEVFGPLKLWIPGSAYLHPRGDGADVLVRRNGHPYLVQRVRGKGVVLALADGMMFTNASLVLADDPVLLVEMFSLLGLRDDGTTRKIELVDDSTGDTPSSPAQTLRRSALAPFMLQLTGFLVLFMLFRGMRFGAARDPRLIERRSFVEHVRAIGVQLARVRAGRHAYATYATWALERLRSENAEQRNLARLIEAVAQRSGQPEALVRETLEHAQQARDELAADRIGNEPLDERSRINARRLAEWTHRTGEAT